MANLLKSSLSIGFAMNFSSSFSAFELVLKKFSVSEMFLLIGSSPTLSWNVTIALNPLSIADLSSSSSLSSKPT